MKNHVIEQVTRDILTFDMLRANNIKQYTISIGPHGKIRLIIGGKLDPHVTPQHHASLHPLIDKPPCVFMLYSLLITTSQTRKMSNFSPIKYFLNIN